MDNGVGVKWDGFRKTLWAPVPSLPNIPRPLDVLLLDKTVTERGRNLVLRLAINNGTDKMQYHVGPGQSNGRKLTRLRPDGIQITPTNGYRLVQWSVNELNTDESGHARTHFVYMTSGEC